MFNGKKGLTRLIVVAGVVVAAFAFFLYAVPHFYLPYLVKSGPPGEKKVVKNYLDQTGYPDDASCIKNQDILPMYGNEPKCARLQASDLEFVDTMDKLTKGNRALGAFQMSWDGRYYFSTGDYDTAMKRFNEGWLLNPDDSNVYLNFAFLLNKQGKTDEASSMLAKTFSAKNVDYRGDYCDTVFFSNMSNANTRFSKLGGFYNEIQGYLQKSNQKFSDDSCHFNWLVDYYLSGDYDNTKSEINIAKQQVLSSTQQDLINLLLTNMAKPAPTPLLF